VSAEPAALDPVADEALFHMEVGPPVGLYDKFVMPPFSILDRRSGPWQERRRRWLKYGFRSELGRDALLLAGGSGDGGCYGTINEATSVFDPVVCELAYRWFSRPGAQVLDPFAGGSVRGIVAAALQRHYTGVDLRVEQIAENTKQAVELYKAVQIPLLPHWQLGDATMLDETLEWDAEYDLVFSCPPYADLEVYSDNPRDISTWSYEEFLEGHAAAIAGACEHLRENRYAVWVIGDLRDKAGHYRGLHHATAAAFRAAGMHALNECVLVDPIGTAHMRASRYYNASRKVVNTHQHVYVFVKGDVRAAAAWAGGEE